MGVAGSPEGASSRVACVAGADYGVAYGVLEEVDSEFAVALTVYWVFLSVSGVSESYCSVLEVWRVSLSTQELESPT